MEKNRVAIGATILTAVQSLQTKDMIILATYIIHCSQFVVEGSRKPSGSEATNKCNLIKEWPYLNKVYQLPASDIVTH